MIAALRRILKGVVNSTGSATPYNQVPPREFYKAARNPYFRKKLIDCSVEEDELNPYYSNILDAVAKDNLGPFPLIICNGTSENLCSALEESWLSWGAQNEVGRVLRTLRRDAAKTGLGVAIPIYDKTLNHPLKYKNICRSMLSTPRDALVSDRIYSGIQYDEKWEPIKIFIQDETSTNIKEYDIEQEGILLWWLKQDNRTLEMIPECSSAFLTYPSIRRFMDAVVRSEEFSASIPMAVELDPKVYRPDDPTSVPEGSFKYDPGMVPTLPPGSSLKGVSTGVSSRERSAMLRMMVAAASRVKNYPVNLAMGDSSNSNMATAQIDIQPWKKTVEIDRFDFSPILHRVYGAWIQHGLTKPGYFQTTSRQKLEDLNTQFYYRVLFEHPDPLKNASSRAVDLASGAKTFHMIYSEQSLNLRREVDRDAKLLNITREEYMKMLIASRSSESLNFLERINAISAASDGQDEPE